MASVMRADTKAENMDGGARNRATTSCSPEAGSEKGVDPKGGHDLPLKK